MPNPNAASPVDPQVLTLFQQELARTAASPGLAGAGPALWPRFAGYYQGLTHLPRKVRRALQRRWRCSLGGIALLCALGQAPALAATINVGGGCTLIDAITAANNDAPTGGCAAGGGADTIALTPGSTHTLTDVNDFTYFTGLPVISSEITIDGGFPRSTIARDNTAPQFGILAVGATGNLMLQETMVSGGAGLLVGPGGIDNRGTLTLDSSTVSGNTAGFFSTGAGGIDNTGTLTLRRSSTVSDNTGRSGGIFNSGILTVEGFSTVSGNTAGALGGGIENRGTLTMNFSTVSGNTGQGGGGIYNGGTMTLGGFSTVSGNTAEGSGGGIENRGTLTLNLSTVSGNTVGGLGGGIYNGAYDTLTVTVNLFSLLRLKHRRRRRSFSSCAGSRRPSVCFCSVCASSAPRWMEPVIFGVFCFTFEEDFLSWPASSLMLRCFAFPNECRLGKGA